MTNTKELKKKIKESGYKIGYLAKQLELCRQALSNKINNYTEFTVNEMDKLSKILKLDDEERKKIFFNIYVSE